MIKISKRVYISADYAESNGDRNVVEELVGWGEDKKHKVDFIDMSQVVSGTVANDDDCRICDLKAEFNRQINASSVVIFIVGDKTSQRTAGCACERCKKGFYDATCTPYKQNKNGKKVCKVYNITTDNDDVNPINNYSYLRHEFEQAKKKNKTIIILYNSMRNERNWLPAYMNDYEGSANPFWKNDVNDNKIGDYYYIKKALGY